jgi:hypothetical protein
MTAMVSGDRAKAAGLTGIAGSLILAGAVVMMAVAAPATPHQQHASTKSTMSTASTTSTATDSMISESWSASRSARPPLASAAVS